MDPADLSNLSEVESLSDSDWLEVASSRASEDTDSIAEFDDSDREDAGGRPSSRRSFGSVGSLHDEEVKGWEGLAEDSSDESTDDRLIAANSFPLSPRQTALGSALDSPLAGDDDPEEEQRVKDALDQSMMSTLSSSRSNSLNASVQTSIVHSRDLRLSFPDPITSSRDNMLSTSYEEVASPPVSDSPPATEAAVGVARPRSSAYNATTGQETTAADPGPSTTPEVPQVDVPRGLTPVITPDFYVVMYGASSAMKWSFVDTLLDKIARGIGLTASSKVVEQANVYTRFLLSPGYGKEDEVARVVSVVDCTDMLDGDDFSSPIHWNRPSLAIVFLPTDSLTLPEHTVYLPVLAQSLTLLDLPSSDRLLDAEQQWDALGIPRSKLAVFSRGSSSVIDQDELERTRPLQVARALRPMFAASVSKQSRRLISKHTLTIFAMVSVMIGYVVHGSLGPSGAPPLPVTAPPSLGGLLLPITPLLNQSFTPSTPSLTLATVPPAAKDSVPTTLPITPSPVSASPEHGPQASTSSTGDHYHDVVKRPSECECGCGLITWPGTPKINTDLMLRPVPSVPSVTSRENGKVGLALTPAHSEGKGKGRAPLVADDSLYSLSVRVAGSLSEYFDFRRVAIAANKDLQELLDALDELVNAIGRQTRALLERSRGPARLVQEHVYQRHTRAVKKARELKEMGGRMISLVGDRMKGGIGMAKDNAKMLKKSAIDDGLALSRDRLRKMARRAKRKAKRDARRIRRSVTA
ncbi:hypothetical protein OBBRIDRAFT_788275 [Obba rivulosa]|uniref:Uncharacterized protein n=1 Tax=Obba rivulosa TaxID=1052685 RepID=A0A8E2J603_9APHY|nr:hypothetical protein OBBRIDRAFT_788275 [Obba rivulosa]